MPRRTTTPLRHLLTRARHDGTYDQVGMNNRTIVDGVDRRTVIRKARDYGRGRRVLVEVYVKERFYYEPPLRTFYVDP